MILSKIEIPTIEMTKEEHSELWNSRRPKYVCGKLVIHWLTSDGNDEILLDGETVYRQIVIKN